MAVEVGTVRRLRVRVLLWGRTDQDAERALEDAQRSPSRNGWEFVAEERSVSATCTLDLEQPGALAAGRDYGRAYVVLHAPAEAAR